MPATSSLLAALQSEGRLAGPLRAHAVTDALRAQWPEGDEESLEYAAMMAAAADSRSLRGVEDRPRRYVVAADVPDVVPVPGEDPTLVDVAVDLVLKRVAAVHADTEDEDAGDQDAGDQAGDQAGDRSGEDDDLAWFATQELPYLL
nr:hypothetical protein [Nocardioides panaciterrulae]